MARSRSTTTHASPPSFSREASASPRSRSIILQATNDKLAHKIFLFDSNLRPEDTAFLGDLTAARKENPNFTLVGTMTEMEKSTQAWTGETGFVTKAMLMKFIDDFNLPIYYLSGPRAMVAAMRKVLNESGVQDPHRGIHGLLSDSHGKPNAHEHQDQASL